MAEVVEYALEKLLPVFELLQTVKLLEPKENSNFIQKCRRYEYQTVKQTKDPNDFLNYADYLIKMLELIKMRRDKNAYHFKYDRIEMPIKFKCAHLFRVCSDRFKELRFFEREIQFLKEAKLSTNCSRAYTRLLQFYGNISSHYVEAGKFEFVQNRSVMNSRTILQLGLRKFPRNLELYACLFEIELAYAKMLKERHEHLIGNVSRSEDGVQQDEEVLSPLDPPKKRARSDSNADSANVDEIIALKLPRIVLDEALRAIDPSEHPAVAHKFWCLANDYSKVAQTLVDELHKLRETLDYDSYLNRKRLNECSKKPPLSTTENEFAPWENKIEEFIAAQNTSEKRIQRFFDKLYLEAPSHISAHLKTIRIRYLNERYPDEQHVRQEYKRLAKTIPTSLNFHAKFVEIEEARETPDTSLIIGAFENAIREFGSTSVECWAKYSEYLLRTAPEKVGAISQRALINLPAEKIQEFYERLYSITNLATH